MKSILLTFFPTQLEKTKKKVQRREDAKRADAEGKKVKGILSTLHFLSKLSQELKEQLLTGLNGLVRFIPYFCLSLHVLSSPPLRMTFSFF